MTLALSSLGPRERARTAWRARVAGTPEPRACVARGHRELSAVPFGGPRDCAREVPDLPQAGRRTYRAEEGRASRRRHCVRVVSRRACRASTRSCVRSTCSASTTRTDAGFPLDGSARAPRDQLRGLPQDAVVPDGEPVVRVVPHRRAQGNARVQLRDVPYDVGRVLPRARTKFDHSRTAFPLTGAHLSVTCASCHTSSTYKNVAFASCASCHTDPHRERFGASCSSCHVTQTWKTNKIDHTRTAFPLRGAARVRCNACRVT